MRKVAVVGACGHIGSRLIRELDDCEITAIDNLSTQRYVSLFADNLPERGIRFVEADITKDDLVSLFRGQDIVIHLAAITDATGSVGRPADVFWVNYFGTQRVAEACVANSCRLLFPSTTSVYGKSEGLVDETAILKPQSPYASSKLKSEQYLKTVDGLRFVIMRFGTIFGVSRGARWHTAIPSFCWSASIGKPIKVWKTALHQKRPYLYLKDCLNSISHCLEKDLFNGEIFNVLTGNFTPHEIISEIRKYRNDTSVTLVDSPILNQLSYTVSWGKFRETGWSPKGTLEAGIAETMELLSRIHR